MTDIEAPEEEDEYEAKKRSALPDLGKRRSINVEEVDTPANAENEWNVSGDKHGGNRPASSSSRGSKR